MAKYELKAEPNSQELTTTYWIKAPLAKVWQAHVDPELVGKWWGPRTLTTDVQVFEPKSGGSWKFVQEDKDGNKFPFHGVMHEVLPQKRIIQTFEYDGLPEAGHVLLATATFSEEDGITKVVNQSVFQSVADRDGMMAAGMEDGERDSVERLEELAATL